MSTQHVSTRALGYGDLPQVIAIERRSFPTPWSLAMFVLELSKPLSICLAGLAPGDSAAEKLAGYLICSRYADVWHVMNIAVDPPLRRHGVASALLEELFRRAGPREAYTLEVRPSNPPAITLYERFGFRSAGTRARYYQDTGEDAVIMWRTAQTLADAGDPEDRGEAPSTSEAPR